MVTRGYSQIGVNLHNDSGKVNIALYNILIPIRSFALLLKWIINGRDETIIERTVLEADNTTTMSPPCQLSAASTPPTTASSGLSPLGPCNKYLFMEIHILCMECSFRSSCSPQNLSNLRWTHPNKNKQYNVLFIIVERTQGENCVTATPTQSRKEASLRPIRIVNTFKLLF